MTQPTGVGRGRPGEAKQNRDYTHLDRLTGQEVALLAALAAGASYRSHGKAMGIEYSTVLARARSAIEKLGAATRTEAVAIAIRKGTI